MNDSHNTVLVVDDDPQALALIMSILEKEGYRVQPADTGKLALISVAAQTPDLILLDVRMAGVNGFEVYRRLRATEAGRRVPVMFISASADREDRVQGLSLGAVDFISKPFQREELLARVRTHVELGQLQAQLEKRVAQRTSELRNAVEQLRLEVEERRRAELALRESEHRFSQIANAAPAIIWTSGPDNCVDFRNEYAQVFSGRSLSELIGDGWSELIHPEDLERQRRIFAEGLDSHRSFQLRYRIRRADGEYRCVLDKGTPRFLPSGQFAGYIGIVFDLTDVKRSQDRALRAKNLENLRVLSAGIAHDFNTMIGAIFGEVDLALSDMAPDSPGRENLVRIDGVAKRAAEVVKLLLAYVGDRSDGDRRDLVDLRDVVAEIVPHLRAPILKKAQIQANLSAQLPHVRANLLQMRLVVLNLILNAIEAIDGNKGLVTIAAGPVEIDGDAEGDEYRLAKGVYVRLEVSDTGNGVADGIQDRIFDPYFTTKLFGRGLGLAAVHGIIRAHRGAIHARSAPGNVTTFEVLLPCANDLDNPDPGTPPE